MDTVERQSHHNLCLPPEIMCMIIDYFLPRSGLHISNDPRLDASLDTISSLLRTSRLTRSEILRRTFDRPLHISITNAEECRTRPACRTELDPRLAKALGLPLYRFPSIDITFAPELKVKPCRGSYNDVRRQHGPIVDTQLVHFRANMICIIRQSNALADAIMNDPTLWTHRELRTHGQRCHFTFSWDGSRGVDKANRSRPFPLWDFIQLESMVGQWGWVRLREGTTWQIRLPEKVATRVIGDAVWEGVRHHERYRSDILEQFPAPSNSAELLERTWPFWWGDFWAGRVGPGWFLDYSDDTSPSASRFIMTMKPADCGEYYYTAERVAPKKKK